MESTGLGTGMVLSFGLYVLIILLLTGLLAVIYILYIRRGNKEAEVSSERSDTGQQQHKVRLAASREYFSEVRHGTVSGIRRAQETLLSASGLPGGVPEYFVFFRPLGTVSGDFYWMRSEGGTQIIVMADCTGHGLKGALLSILGMTLLNKIVTGEKIYMPDEILRQLRYEVIRELNRETGGNSIRDGMDMAVCSVDPGKGTLLYSGANCPLFLVREGRLLNFSPDKMPVSAHYRMDPFTLHTIELKKGDTFYIFSDGYADQPGGPGKKKFMSRRFKKLFVEMEGLPMDNQRERLDSVFREWKGDMPQIDDVTVIGIRY